MTRILVACFVFVLVGAAATLVLSLRPSVLGSVTAAGAINPDVFSDGMGIYVLDNNKYSMLVWKKKIIGPKGVEERELMEAAQEARRVNKGVRFFSYGIDFSKWPVVPPYALAFCIARDAKTVEGAFPIRIKMIDHNNGPVYELVLPELIDNLASGTVPNLFWAINFQFSCSDGWIFKF